MARKFTPIKDLNDSKQLFRIGVRIVDLWYVQKSPEQGHLEMIVMDEKGDKIQIGVKNDEFVQWSSKLKEHSTYVMETFSVVPYTARFMTCEHAYKMFFTYCTTLKEVHIPAIPPKQYNFKKFCDINSGSYRTEYLVDIIGVVDQVTNTNPVGKLKKANITLKDISGNAIQYTLWEDLAMQFINFCNQRTDPTCSIIIILTNAKIKEPQGNFPAEVSNSWNSSRLFINEDMVDIQNFKASFVPTQSQQPSSQIVSQMSASSQFSEQERFLYKTQVKSIFEITNHIKQEVSNIVTVGTTVMVCPNKNGWYYEGCTSCTRRAGAVNAPFTCESMHYSEKSVPRYKVDIKVVHKKGSGKFVFWDQQCSEMLGKSALCLRDEMIAVGEDNPKVYPEELDNLCARTLALRVKVSPTYHNCSVMKHSENPTIIQAILDQLPTDESQGSTKLDKVVSNVEDSEQFATQSLSATAENEPELPATRTPAKRLNIDIPCDEDHSPNVESAKLSTTKLKKHIKKE